jgi:hypothetical protein
VSPDGKIPQGYGWSAARLPGYAGEAMPNERYLVRLMFEWGGGCFWGGNEAASSAFGVGPIEDRLPLSPATREKLAELSAWHDTSLNRDYPPDPGPWPRSEYERFEKAVGEVLPVLRSELGPVFKIVYVPL